MGQLLKKTFWGTSTIIRVKTFCSKTSYPNSNSLVISGSELIQPSSAILFLKEVFSALFKVYIW
ncbi:hypothetical protein EGY05_08015 [Chryseobacterium arthrosphaerae]|nr:hypothetical protein EGY05_08015 [Chryseobacterium arthrosphaerae]